MQSPSLMEVVEREPIPHPVREPAPPLRYPAVAVAAPARAVEEGERSWLLAAMEDGAGASRDPGAIAALVRD
ncbi:MAG TPA: hypothetical protein VFI96_01835, partial [Longimicrobiaceae bacterium]|nr:hypothetical protein [Longimicrobiaceae bacterium]